MKKLGKLVINPEKVMKNEDLVMLRGGYGELNCMLACKWDNVTVWDTPCDEETCISDWLAGAWCTSMCGQGGWNNLICVGPLQ